MALQPMEAHMVGNAEICIVHVGYITGHDIIPIGPIISWKGDRSDTWRCAVSLPETLPPFQGISVMGGPCSSFPPFRTSHSNHSTDCICNKFLFFTNFEFVFILYLNFSIVIIPQPLYSTFTPNPISSLVRSGPTGLIHLYSKLVSPR